MDPDAYVRGAVGLVAAVQQLSLARDLASVQEIVRHAARNLTDADGATFVLRDGDRCFYADEDAIAPLWKGHRFPLDACISGWSMVHRRSVAIDDIYTDDRIPHDAYRETFVKSLVMVPIRSADPLGAIGNYWSQLHVATGDEIHLLETLADSTALALEHVSLRADRDQRVSTVRIDALEQELSRVSSALDDLSARGSDRDELGVLTTRQREIVGLLRRGLRVRTVAERLGISESTVRKHLNGVYDRLGVRSQRELLERLSE